MEFRYKKFILKPLLKILFFFYLLTNHVVASEIGVIGFVIGNAFNQDGKKLNVGDPWIRLRRT